MQGPPDSERGRLRSEGHAEPLVARIPGFAKAIGANTAIRRPRTHFVYGGLHFVANPGVAEMLDMRDEGETFGFLF